jgi:hypothetical protein
MNPKRMLSRAVGLVQSSIGTLIMIFAFFIFYNIFDLQIALGFPAEAIGLYLWSFIIFGLLSVISGLFLFYES